jgi:hypothetical protein
MFKPTVAGDGLLARATNKAVLICIQCLSQRDRYKKIKEMSPPRYISMLQIIYKCLCCAELHGGI